MKTQYPILWLVLWVDQLFSFGCNVEVCEEESVSDVFICKVIHQDFLNSSFSRHWTRGGSRPYIPMWDDQQHSKPQLSLLWLSYINVLSVLSILSSSYHVVGGGGSVISCHRPFLPGTSLEHQWWSPSLRLQVSDCCTLCIMCDVPSISCQL
jgi:hypothetical protein